MAGFVRTLTILLAGLCLLLISGGVTTLVLLRKAGAISPEKARDWVLTEEERTWLADLRNKPPEKPERQEAVVPPGGASEEELLARIAERANADRATTIIEELRRQKLALDERQAWIDQQHAELSLVRADLDRLKRQLEAQEQTLKDERAKIDGDRATWAAAQVSNAQGVQLMGEAEQTRYKEQAKLYEQMKDAAWQSLKKFEPKEVARYLALMDQKKAAKLLSLAEADKAVPEDFTLRIHRELLTLDLAGITAGQAGRLAQLYAFLKPAEAAGYLKSSAAEEVADILQAIPDPKKRAGILEAIRSDNENQAIDVQRILTRRGPAGVTP